MVVVAVVAESAMVLGFDFQAEDSNSVVAVATEGN